MFKKLLTNLLSPSLALMLIVFGIWGAVRAWEVVSGSQLITPEYEPTLIQVDFIQFIAFLVAWSAFLLTVGSWIANWMVSLLRRTDRTSWEFTQHLATHPDIEQQIRGLEDKVSGEVEPLLDEVGKLREENAKLRSVLAEQPLESPS